MTNTIKMRIFNMGEFIYSNVAKEMEVYGYDSVIKSHCRMCHGGCGVLVYTKNGKVAKIAGDPDCPINHGTRRNCAPGILNPFCSLSWPKKRIL